MSREEAQQSMPRMAGRFDQFDGNADGKITRDEMHGFRVRQRRCAEVSE